MRSSRSLLCLVFALMGRTAMADGVPAECPASPAMLIAGTDRIACQVSGLVAIERYLGPKPESPYASAFDRRELVVAYGKSIEAVKAIAGIKAGSRASQTQRLLLQPPLVDYIAKRSPLPKASSYKQWSIASEKIEYGAQGGAQGFLLECATARRSVMSTMVVVAECFPFEEKARFFKTLDAVRWVGIRS